MSRRARARGPQHTSTERGNAPRRVRWTALFAVAAMTFTTVSGAALAESQSGDSGTTAAGPTSASTEGGSAAPAQGAQSGSETAPNATESAEGQAPSGVDVSVSGDSEDASNEASRDSGAVNPHPAEDAGPGTATSERSVAAVAASNPFVCQAGYVYSIQSGGDVRQIGADGKVTTVYDSRGGVNGSSMNGLGIGDKGGVAYWYEREGTLASQIKTLVKFENGNVAQVPNSASADFGTNSLVAGAVDPRTGTFLVGKIAGVQVSLWAWTGSEYKALGKAKNDSLPGGSLNGDMAFDAAGNLYVVSSTTPDGGNVSVNITMVKAADIANAIKANNSNATIPASNVSSKTIKADSGFNGIAFDSDGYVYVGNSTTLLKYDPTTWALVSTVTAGLGSSTDLSSCSTPPTLEVVKDLPDGRVSSVDQFRLSIADSTGTETTSVTTEGQQPGVQDATAGPAPVVAGSRFTVRESAGSAGTDLANYTSTLACVDSANANAPVPVDKGSLTIPKGKANAASVVCTFTNTPNLSSAAWTKVGADGSTALAGSTWKLTGPGSSPTVEVIDNVGQSDYNGLDIDEAPGKFLVEKLRVGSYTLVETAAPEGYILDATVRSFKVETGGTNVVVGTFKNSPITGSVAWTKVGDLGDSDLIGGTSWTITPVNPGGAAISVADNQGRDTDAGNGKFLVKDLPYGTYTLKESSAPVGYIPSDTTYTFTISSDGVTVGVNGSEPIVNTRQKGAVSWKKVDQSGTALAGSEWSLKGPDGTSIPIVDNEALDVDKTDGSFTLNELAWGDYELVETKAPAGYSLSTDIHTFTIDGAHLTIDLKAITNKQYDTPSLPLTGGMGTDTFLLLGGGLIAAAGVGGWVHRRRSLRMQTA